MVSFHARYVNLIYSIAYRILNDGPVAEEATQDAFMKVWNNAAQFDVSRGSVVGWLIGIARNVAIDSLRRRAHQVPTEAGVLEDGESVVALPNDWPDRERVDGLRFAVEALPQEQRQVIELSYYGGMSQSEIADMLTVPLGTVKTRMRLGMQKLRQAWFNE